MPCDNKYTASDIVKQNLFDLFIEKVYSKHAKNNYGTQKTIFKRTDNTLSLQS